MQTFLNGVAPNILKGDLAAPIGIKLDGRHWSAFLKWFDRTIASELLNRARDSNVPALQAVRRSNPKGGFPDKSESVFFLAFLDEDVCLASPSEPESAKPIDSKQRYLGKCWPKSNSTFSPMQNAREFHYLKFWQRTICYINRCGIGKKITTVASTETIRKRWQLGVSKILLAILLMNASIYIPTEHARVVIVTLSIVLGVFGAKDMFLP